MLSDDQKKELLKHAPNIIIRTTGSNDAPATLNMSRSGSKWEFKPLPFDEKKLADIDPDGFKRVFPGIHYHLDKEIPINAFGRVAGNLFGLESAFVPTSEDIAREVLYDNIFADQEGVRPSSIDPMYVKLFQDEVAKSIQNDQEIQAFMESLSFTEALTDKWLGITKAGLAAWKARSDKSGFGIYEGLSMAEDLTYGVVFGLAHHKLVNLRINDMGGYRDGFLEKTKQYVLASASLTKNRHYSVNGLHLLMNIALPAVAELIEEKHVLSDLPQKLEERLEEKISLYFGKHEGVPIIGDAVKAGKDLVMSNVGEGIKQITGGIDDLISNPKKQEDAFYALERAASKSPLMGKILAAGKKKLEISADKPVAELAFIKYGHVAEKVLALLIRLADGALTTVPMYTSGFARAIYSEKATISLPEMTKYAFNSERGLWLKKE